MRLLLPLLLAASACAFTIHTGNDERYVNPELLQDRKRRFAPHPFLQPYQYLLGASPDDQLDILMASRTTRGEWLELLERKLKMMEHKRDTLIYQDQIRSRPYSDYVYNLKPRQYYPRPYGLSPIGDYPQLCVNCYGNPAAVNPNEGTYYDVYMNQAPYKEADPQDLHPGMMITEPSDDDSMATAPSTTPYHTTPRANDETLEQVPVDVLPDIYYIEPPKTRQNPNLSGHRAKNLVSEDLEQMRQAGSDHKETESVNQVTHGDQGVMRNHAPIDSDTGFYTIALLAGTGAAVVVTLFGTAIGIYRLTQRAKLAADVEYPAYGVTGPCIDNSGDRRLAHSAHIYHYQHQKQQIIAMERNGVEERHGSTSDADSEEDNVEGDYTVYECPGFASTGNLEVQNPLFAEEATPTPTKSEKKSEDKEP